MSSLARWSYTGIATVWPRLSYDQYSGQTVYGDPYEIACTWGAGRDSRHSLGGVMGDELLASATVYTEDSRPQVGDQIQLSGQAVRRTIRATVDNDASMFGEPDYPDRELTT